jgi:hypothetical protein
VESQVDQIGMQEIPFKKWVQRVNPDNISALLIAVINFHYVLNEDCAPPHASLVVDQEQNLLAARGHSDVPVLPVIFIAPGPARHIASVLKFDPDLLYMAPV